MTPNRRQFVLGLAALGGTAALRPNLRAWADGTPNNMGLPGLSGTRFDLHIARATVNITGKPCRAMLINGLQPGPLLRWREGDTVTLNVTNHMDVPTSLHWHGILVPTGMDGVPGLSYPGIAPGETFTYRFPVRQSGTYWYHSHTGFQEQTGLAGPLVIDPRDPDPEPSDRDYVIHLGDWSDEDPHTIFRHLKTIDGYYNNHKRTMGDFFDDAAKNGLGATIRDRAAWGRMRMGARDIVDVSGAQTGGTYTYLINGHSPAANWTGLFKPGERIRLRFINGSAMSYFDIRIPGLKMTIVAADGSNVEPVTVDEFRIAVAEAYDVIVEPTANAYTIFAQSMDRSGFARATLAQKPGATALIPPMDPVYSRTMADMGMAHMNMKGMDMKGAEKPAMNQHMPPAMSHDMNDDMSHDMAMPADKQSDMAMPAMSMPARPNANGQIAYPQPRDVHLKPGPAVVHIAENPTPRLDDPGDGLRDNGRRVLTYADLSRREDGPQNAPFDTHAPDAEILLHLTGNMHRYVFGFNGQTYNQSQPVRLPFGQRIKVTLINDTMMEHPIHLHGMFTELDNGKGRLNPLKHTVSVKPGEKLHYFVNATEPGRWAYHCHLLYHMEAGMFTTAVVA